MSDAPGRAPDAPLVGIVGGGQLGRMLALAGMPLGLRFRFLEPRPHPSVEGLGEIVRGAYDDPEALDRFAKGLSVVTYEFENVPVASAERLASRGLAVFPPPAALEMAQDRLVEKEGFRGLGVSTAPFRAVASLDELERAVEEIGLPAVVKTRRFGYDGKGQEALQEPGDLRPAWERLQGRPLLLEGFVPFTRELSVLAVRSRTGETRVYPLVQNEHRAGILWESRAPAPDVSPVLRAEAEGIVGRILDRLDYVGVLAVELFETDEGLLANELAPRVHNSGHWTQNGAVTSQFENHLRAVLGFPLGGVEATGCALMMNLIGAVPSPARILGRPTAHLHLYDKNPRPGRKLGHVNLVGTAWEEVEADRSAIAAILEG